MTEAKKKTLQPGAGGCSRSLAALSLIGLALAGWPACAATGPSASQEDQILAARIERLAPPPVPDDSPGFQVSPPAAATKAQKEQYQKGQNLLKGGNYKGAAQVFQQILAADLKAPLAPNARYWLGECYYAQGRYEEALAEFDRCCRDYPLTNKASDALLKRAYCHNMLGRGQEAMRDLDLLLRNYPQSPAAGLVKSGRIKFRQPG